MKTTLKGYKCILLVLLLLSLSGCGKEQLTNEDKKANEPATASGTTSETLSEESEIDTQNSDPEESNKSDLDISEIFNTTIADAIEGREEIPAEDNSPEKLTPEEQAAKESYEHWDEYCNSKPLDLTPALGEFMTLNPEPEDAFPYMDSPDGDVYGFYDDLTDGCSVWCAIDYDKYVNNINATSTLAPQGNNSYDAANLGNRSRSNAWVEGVEGNGIGESVTIVRNYTHGGDAAGFKEYGYDSFFFPNLCIVNGFAKNEKAWKNNGRVKSLKLFFNEEYVATLELEDTMKPQFISLSGLHLSALDGEDSIFRFEIADVYPGDKYEDTVLTGIEIEVFTENH